jgi:hypothetical protein
MLRKHQKERRKGNADNQAAVGLLCLFKLCGIKGSKSEKSRNTVYRKRVALFERKKNFITEYKKVRCIE